MLSKADDYPIHQTAEPIAYAGTDRNFYDRYFFNGYDPSGELFFAAALGVYPHLNIIDAAFCVRHDGVQHNLHASRVLQMERMDTVVGPIAIEVLQPLERLRLAVDSSEHDLHAEIIFEARTAAIEEPRFTHRIGPRTFLDYTRMTQNGRYQGTISLAGQHFDLEAARCRGTRDRSWGVRPIGSADPQPSVPVQMPQFFWLWAPLNFDQHVVLYHRNDDASGRAWNSRGVLAHVGNGAAREFSAVSSQLRYRSGSRRIAEAVIELRQEGAVEARATLAPKFHFYMPGLGYMHPEWGHGHFKGELAVGYDRYDAATVDDEVPGLLHIQAFCDATLELADGERHRGAGVLEQLIIGPHAPSGFQSLFDPAP